ncbi:hypothetical protein CFRS1_v010723 [Colletotrichum fructicola]|nr:hypothetical protein CFRS1_v010723 [Colletotrichum fructicola]
MGLGSNTSNDFDMNTPESPQDVAMSFALDSHLNVNAPVPQYVQDSSSSTPTHSYDTSSLPDYKEPDYDYVAGFGFRRTPSPGSGSNHLAPSPTQRRTWEVNTDVRMQILSDRHDRIESRQSGSEAMQESLDDRMDMISERQDVDSMRISSIRKDLEEIQDALRNGFRGTWTSDHPAFCRPERAGRPTGLAKKARAHPLRGAKGSSVKCKHSRDNENEDEGDALPCPKRRKPSPSAGTRPVVPPPGDHFSDSDTEMMEIDNVSVIECATVYAMAKNARPTTKGEKAASKAPAPGSAPAPSQNNPRLPRHTHPRYGLRNLNQMQADRERREAAKQAADAARRQEAHEKRIAAKEERGGAAAARGAHNSSKEMSSKASSRLRDKIRDKMTASNKMIANSRVMVNSKRLVNKMMVGKTTDSRTTNSKMAFCRTSSSKTRIKKMRRIVSNRMSDRSSRTKTISKTTGRSKLARHRNRKMKYHSKERDRT